MTQINFKQLQTFVSVADQNSFRRAAETLQTTQPNISSRISALENTLNVTLMERDAGFPHPLHFHARFDADTSPSYVRQAANIAAQITASIQ